MDRRAVIVSTGRYLGEESLSSEEVARRCGVNPEEVPELLRDSYPVRRRVRDSALSTSDLFVRAAQQAIARANIRPEQLSLLICAGGFPDFVSPPTAARVQHALGAVNAGFMDLQSGCASFLMALSIASNHLRCERRVPSSRGDSYVLVVGGNLYSKFLHPNDLFSHLLFSDAAGAFVIGLGQDSETGILESTYYGDGSYWSHWGIFAGGTWKGFSQEALEQGFQYFKLHKRYEKGIHERIWLPVLRETLEKTGWSAAEVDRVFLTQTRGKTISLVCEEMGWDPQVSHPSSHKYGYSGPACIPVGLDDALECGAVKPGQKILMLSSGIGVSCCAVSLIWPG